MTDNVNNTLNNDDDLLKQMLAEKRAELARREEAQKKANEFEENYQKLLSNPDYDGAKPYFEKELKERDYKKFGVEGVGLLMERVNMTLEKEKLTKQQTETPQVEEGASVDRQTTPSSVGETGKEGDIPMLGNNVIDFTKLNEEQIDPKIKRTAERIKNLQSRRATSSSWESGKFGN